MMVRADGIETPCSAWVVQNRNLSFTCDHSALPPEAFPYDIDPVADCYAGASGDDGYVEGYSGSWFPTYSSTNTSGTRLYITSRKSGLNYIYDIALMKFVTSAIPDDATIPSADLHVSATVASYVDSLLDCSEHYIPSSWPIDSGIYTAAVLANDAVTDRGFMTGWNSHPTQNLANISKTGSTGLRYGLTQESAPTGTSDNSIYSYDNGSNAWYLEVTYTLPAVLC